MHSTDSRSPSPIETRHRLSSPTYDEQVSMSQQELEAFDEYECTQYAPRAPSPPQPESETKRKIASADSTDEWDDQDRRKRRSLNRRDSIDEVFAPLPADARLQAGGAAAVVAPSFSGFASAASLPLEGPRTHASEEDAVQSAHTPTRLHDTGFTSAAKLIEGSFEQVDDKQPSPSPDASPDQDYSDWFSAKMPEGASTGFQTARAIHSVPPPAADPTPLDPALAALPTFTSCRVLFEGERGPPVSQINADVPTIAGFSPAINYVHSLESGTTLHDWAKPSADALALAAAKMKAWEAQIDEDFTVDPPIPEPPEDGVRPALRALDNSFGPGGAPESPSPAGAGFARASGMGKLPALGLGKGKKAFKSPLLTRPKSATASPTKPAYVNSPLNPKVATTTSTSRSTAFATPTRTGTSSFTPPVPRVGGMPSKSLGLTPRRLGFTSAAGKPKFVTPFKAGMRPGEPGRLELEQKAKEALQQANVTVVGSPRPAYYNNKATAKTTFFRIGKYADRQTLESIGLRPQMYDEVELSNMVGNDYDGMKQLTPDNALFYRFHSRFRDSVPSQPSEFLGPGAALRDLQEAECELATHEWVDNHWPLILWKLAGMVCLQPQLEADPGTRRWCWDEVINQFLYRYERELNSGSRPPLRLITTHDAPATCPMVLCVTKITWHDGPRDADGSTPDHWAVVEMTDGWYRIRVAVDDPIERAITKGHIRPGRKLAIQNARLCHQEGREPAEPLDAYLRMNLEICGNSSHLAPWNAKLGFVRRPWVATLDSLTADGGLVTLIDVVVEKVLPIAYTEFTTTTDGKKAFLGTLSEKEESEAQDKWRAQREAAAQKLRDDYDRKIYHWIGWAETFEARAGSSWKPTDENEHLASSAEDQWMNLVDEAISLSQLKRDLTTDRAGWLAYHARRDIEKARESLSEEIGKDLEADFPPRDSRSFRVIVVKDARWSKREPFRLGQINIWDILNFVQTEGGKPGHFEVGERYLISNLMPSHPSAWMDPDTDAMVYFKTLNNTRFQQVKSGPAPID